MRVRVCGIVHRDRRLRDVGGEHHLAHALGRPVEGGRGGEWRGGVLRGVVVGIRTRARVRVRVKVRLRVRVRLGLSLRLRLRLRLRLGLRVAACRRRGAAPREVGSSVAVAPWG